MALRYTVTVNGSEQDEPVSTGTDGAVHSAEDPPVLKSTISGRSQMVAHLLRRQTVGRYVEPVTSRITMLENIIRKSRSGESI